MHTGFLISVPAAAVSLYFLCFHSGWDQGFGSKSAFVESLYLDPDLHFDPDPKFFFKFFHGKNTNFLKKPITGSGSVNILNHRSISANISNPGFGSGSANVSNPGSGSGSA